MDYLQAIGFLSYARSMSLYQLQRDRASAGTRLSVLGTPWRTDELCSYGSVAWISLAFSRTVSSKDDRCQGREASGEAPQHSPVEVSIARHPHGTEENDDKLQKYSLA